MTHPSRLHRLIGVLEQMLGTVRARTVLSPSLTPGGAIASCLCQRQDVEWLCDNNITAFRDMPGGPMIDARVVSLSNFPPSLTWGCCAQDTDTLYNGSRPFVFYTPACVTYVLFEEIRTGVHRLVVELSPLALRDIVALDALVDYVSPAEHGFPRRIVVNTTITTSAELVFTDTVFGSPSGAVSWSDVQIGDYLLAEIGVFRLFDEMRGWSIRYSLHDVARIATMPM